MLGTGGGGGGGKSPDNGLSGLPRVDGDLGWRGASGLSVCPVVDARGERRHFLPPFLTGHASCNIGIGRYARAVTQWLLRSVAASFAQGLLRLSKHVDLAAPRRSLGAPAAAAVVAAPAAAAELPQHLPWCTRVRQRRCDGPPSSHY